MAGLKEKQDVSDFFDLGGTVEELEKLADAAPVFEPTEPVSGHSATNAVCVRNFEFVFVDGKRRKQAIRPTQIGQEVLKQSEGWPKRVGQLLFVDVDGSICFLPDNDTLFAWLAELGPVHWSTGTAFDGQQLTPKGEFHAHLRNVSEGFVQAEALPHQPPMENVYYAWRKPDGYTPDGSHLERLVGFFDNVETADDEALVRAMFITPLWGGLPGTRPAFAVMASDRGFGKSTLTDALGELYGMIEVEPNGRNEDRVVTRLLSEAALVQRVVRIDNIKGGMSSGLLESLITTQRISGHRMYQGEASRPNTLTFLLTGNTIRLSRDMAERSFTIRLARPTPRPSWREDLFAFIRENRERIIADSIHLLKQEPYRTGARDRWQSWTDEVLSRCTDDPEAVVRLNQARRDDCDDELDEAQVIGAAITDHLNIETTVKDFVSSSKMTEIVNTALNVKWTSKKVANAMRGHIEAGRLPGIEKIKTRRARGYEIRDGCDACDG